MTLPQGERSAPGVTAEPQLRAPEPEDLDLSAGRIAAKMRDGLATGGEIVLFTGRAVRTFPDMFRHHFTEVFHQAGVLILSSALVIWLMTFVMGSQCGLEASYSLESYGAPLYAGSWVSFCGMRELMGYMWGWMLAAKVGCGYVAEIGSMRISDEIDAMEVMGVKSKSFIVVTRIAAAAIATPFIWIVGLGFLFIGAYLFAVPYLGDVSAGGYLYNFWLYQTPYDLFAAFCKSFVETIIIVSVALYYGYNASGGPVGVGRATAKSMVINVVLISVVGVVGSAGFWGLNPNVPIAN